MTGASNHEQHAEGSEELLHLVLCGEKAAVGERELHASVTGRRDVDVAVLVVVVERVVDEVGHEPLGEARGSRRAAVWRGSTSCAALPARWAAMPDRRLRLDNSSCSPAVIARGLPTWPMPRSHHHRPRRRTR